MISLLIAALAAPDFNSNPFYWFGLEERLTANVALADMDGDGDLDVLAANGRHWAGQDLVYLNEGSGRLMEARRIGEAMGPSYAVLPIDLDGDGDLDALTIRDKLPIQIFENDGKAALSLVGQVAGSGGNARGGIVADFDGDGHDDLYVVRRAEADLYIRGTGQLSMSAAQAVGSEAHSTGVSVGDVDGDGDLDLAVARRNDDLSVLMINDGKGRFTEAPITGSEGDHRKVELADINTDGRLELVLASTDGTLDIREQGKGGWTVRDTLTLPTGQAQSLIAHDMDGDGDVDLVAAGEKGAALFWNEGAAGWTRLDLPPSDDTTYGLAAGDMNGDGKVDLVTANSGAVNEVLRAR